MATNVTELFGIAYPLFAFTHCRDVVVAVSKAGGLGVLGAALHADERLEIDLQWIDEQLGDIPYGVDLLMPANYVSAEKGGLDQKSLKDFVLDEHKQFLDTLLTQAGVPELLEYQRSSKTERGLRFSQKQAMGVPMQYDVGFQRQCWHIHLLTHWMGDEGWVKRGSAQYRRFVYHSDVVRLHGSILRKFVDDEGGHCVEVATTSFNQRGEDVMSGRAIVALPSREQGTSPVARRL